MDSDYATVEERTKALQYHTASLQQPENSGIQLYTNWLECILVTPTATYDKQVEENKRLLNVKKLSNEIIMGKTTEDTAMELDGEGVANFEQLQDLIQKECDKRDRKYVRLEDKCYKLEQQVTQKDHQKNKPQRDRSPNHKEPGASKKNESNQRNAINQQRTRPKIAPVNNSGPKNRRNPESPGQATEKNSGSRLKKRKQTYIALAKQIESESAQQRWQENTPKEATTKKLIAQFRFAGDPTLSIRHNASITLAKMATWYYFSRPSNMALHDFTK